jgi:hypothetical protein
MSLACVPASALVVAFLARRVDQLLEGQRRDEIDRHVLFGLRLRQRRLEPFEAEHRGAVLGVEEDEAVLEHDLAGLRRRVFEDRPARREDRLVEIRHVDEHALEVLAGLVDLARLDPPAVEIRGHAGAQREARAVAGQLEHPFAHGALGVRGEKHREGERDDRGREGEEQPGKGQLARREAARFEGEQLAIRREAAEPDEGSDEDREGEGPREGRDQLEPGDPGDLADVEAAVHDQVGIAEQVRQQDDEPEGRRREERGQPHLRHEVARELRTRQRGSPASLTRIQAVPP